MRGMLLILAVTLVMPALANEVHRCEIEGRTVFQGVPCPGQVVVTDEPTLEQRQTAEELRRKMREAAGVGDETRGQRWRRQMDRAAEIETGRLNWRNARPDPNRERLAREVALAVMNLSLHNPDSLQIVNWGPLQTNGHGYRIDLRYRAKNRLGAFALEGKRFYYDADMRPQTATDTP